MMAERLATLDMLLRKSLRRQGGLRCVGALWGHRCPQWQLLRQSTGRIPVGVRCERYVWLCV